MSASQDVQRKCSTHAENILEFFCSSCKKSACRECITSCHRNKHEVIPRAFMLNEFNKQANEVINIAKEIKQKLDAKFHSIYDNNSDFETHLKKCKTDIENQTGQIIEKVQKISKELMLDLENICKQKKEAFDGQVEEVESHKMTVKTFMDKVNKLMNKPEDTEHLVIHKTHINAVRQNILDTCFDKSCHEGNLTPNFIPFKHLDEVMRTDGIGKILSVDNRYTIDKSNESITITNGQPFAVKVSRLTDSDTCQLAATLRNPSGEESATEVEDHGSGEYRMTGICNGEGDWLMKITAGGVQIKGSPVNVKVQKLGLVNTIDNIKKHKRNKSVVCRVTDIALDTDGCILVLSDSNQILKFSQSGSFVACIQVKGIEINRMHQMGDGHMVYSDYFRKSVKLCNNEFKKIRSFGNGKLESMGFSVNNETRVLYVANKNAVLKFNVDDGELLGKIGSMKKPQDVTLTKEGHVIVADTGNNRIQMFHANGDVRRILVGCGKEDGKVYRPCGVAIDIDGNIIVASKHKLQQFDKNGVFIKRIDHKDDGILHPAGISVISNKPRRVAVANLRANNVKIFNY